MTAIRDQSPPILEGCRHARRCRRTCRLRRTCAARPARPTAGRRRQEAPAPAPAAAEPTTISLWWWTAEPWNSAANTYNTVQDKIKINLRDRRCCLGRSVRDCRRRRHRSRRLDPESPHLHAVCAAGLGALDEYIATAGAEDDFFLVAPKRKRRYRGKSGRADHPNTYWSASMKLFRTAQTGSQLRRLFEVERRPVGDGGMGFVRQLVGNIGG